MEFRKRISHVQGVVWANIRGEVAARTEKAIMIESDELGDVWIPKSVIETDVPDWGDVIEGLWLKTWFCRKEGIPFDED